MSRLLAVHAHPDDETLSTGALLATCAAAGWSVTVVTCTRGEQGEVIGPAADRLVGNGPALAAHRLGELADALAALGVDDGVLLDTVGGRDDGPAPDRDARHDGSQHHRRRYVDSGMAWLGPGRAGRSAEPPEGAFVAVDVDEAAGRLARLLRERRPDVVVGYEPGGGYGHPDHVHAHRVMTRAVELAEADGPDGTPAWPVPVVLWAALDGTRLRRAMVACAAWVATGDGDGMMAADPADPLPCAAVDEGEVGLRVPVAPVLDRVLAALSAHATQVQAVRRRGGEVAATFALSNRVLQPVGDHECYRIVRWSAGVRWPDGVRVP